MSEKSEKADNRTIVKWWLKCLTKEASNLSTPDLEWVVKMEDAFKRQGEILTPKQMNVLEGIYKKYA